MASDSKRSMHHHASPVWIGCNARTGRLAAFCDACAELLGASANDVGRIRTWIGEPSVGNICKKTERRIELKDGSTSRIAMGSFDIQ